ncbi:MAG: SOS response-associated peptidase [Candidatus Thiodiazotropha sp.]|jgi:putative SOS response-associated peptidase YedK
MCGRFYLDVIAEELIEQFGLSSAPQLSAHYNIAPTQQIAAIKSAGENRELVMLHWGLIPSWAKDKKFAYRTINARAETVESKPSFRAAFKYRRCLIPASGFFEWKATNQGKQPYCITTNNGKPIAFAGLYEHWEGNQGEKIDSCTIIVTEAKGEIATIHDRMPVILSPHNYDAWLDEGTKDPVILKPLLLLHETDDLRLYPVSRSVNSPRNNSPDNIRSI